MRWQQASSLAGSNGYTFLPAFPYKGNSGEFISGLILVDLCPMYWYCQVLFLDSLFSTKTVRKWSNWPRARTAFSRKQRWLKRSLTEEFGYSWTKKHLYLLKFPFCQQLQMCGREKAGSSNTVNQLTDLLNWQDMLTHHTYEYCWLLSK